MSYYPFLANVPFMRLSDPEEKLVTGSTLPHLLKPFTETVVNGTSRIVTTWPAPLVAPALLHQLAVLWHVIDRNYAPEEPSPGEKLTSLATLVWPFTAPSRRCLDTLLVDRTPILAHNSKRRCSGGCREYHTLLNHLRHLNPDRNNGRLTEHQKEKLEQSVGNQHPTLGEIAPVLVIENDTRASVTNCGKIFYRRALRFMRGRMEAVNESLYLPTTAPYLLMGLLPETDLWNYDLIIHLRLPDVLILDLPLAEKCYGESWPEKAKRIIYHTKQKAKLKEAAMPPLFVVARGPEDAYRFRTEVATERQMESLVVNTSPDPLANYSHASYRSLVPGYIVTLLASHLTPLLRRAQRLADDLEKLDTGTAETVRMMQHFLRRIICAPGGMKEFQAHLLDAGIRPSIHLDPLGLSAQLCEHMRLGRAGLEENRVRRFIDDFSAALEQMNETTPANRFLELLVRTEMERNTQFSNLYSEPRHSLVAMPDGLTERFAHSLLASRGFPAVPWLRLTNGKKGLNNWGGRLGGFDKAYFIMPRWDTIERILAWEDTPKTVQIVCDEATALSLCKKVAWLKDRRLFLSLAGRMNALWLALDEALEHSEYDLDPDEVATSYPSSSYEGEGRPMALVTASGRRINLHEGTRVVRYREEAEPRPFTSCAAAAIEQGDTVFVIDEEYVQMVSRHCGVSRTAPEWLRAYHVAIQAGQKALAGATVRDKARSVLKLMKGQDSAAELPDLATVVNWLDVDDLFEESLDVVQPHAPRHRGMFDRFSTVMGVPDSLAEKFWCQAIKATRSLRIRAGFSSLNFSIDILIAPDSVMADWDGGADDLRRCEEYARDMLEEISEIIKEDKP